MTTQPTQFVVLTASAAMPRSCWGRYRRVAVVEVVAGAPTPKMISRRARGVVRIVSTWERCNVGRAMRRCAYSLALAAAREMADQLNRGASAA